MLIHTHTLIQSSSPETSQWGFRSAAVDESNWLSELSVNHDPPVSPQQGWGAGGGRERSRRKRGKKRMKIERSRKWMEGNKVGRIRSATGKEQNRWEREREVLKSCLPFFVGGQKGSENSVGTPEMTDRSADRWVTGPIPNAETARPQTCSWPKLHHISRHFGAIIKCPIHLLLYGTNGDAVFTDVCFPTWGRFYSKHSGSFGGAVVYDRIGGSVFTSSCLH